MVLRQFELSEKVRSYDPSANISMIDQAYVFAMKVHGNQKRESGDPYFHHPVEVAGILADMHLDSATIVTALLHDTVEDTLATLSDIEEIFGVEISRLVDGVTKLSKIELQSNDTKQAENFRKLVLAMSNDIRVLLVKLADRLHNMRTLHFVKSEDKRRRIAKETIEIYAPLAERIGMQHMKDELEDLAFKNLHKDSYDTIMERLSFLMHDDNKLIVKEIIEELHKILKKNDVESNISGRVKRPYSIWRKMCRQDVSIEQLSDIMAFRIIVDSVSECYQALGVIHSGYKVMPGRFKDYISTPKPNNYKSLHTTVFGPRKQKIEVQIRTKDMDAVAEYGVAAHWQYKQSSDGFGVGAGSDKKDSENLTYRWIKSLLDILDNTSNPEEFLENTKLEMFHDQVFVFTPNGDLISLPNGSTPVDFAYAIHSAVGDKCSGAKVNGRMVPLRTILQNGDQVEILTSASQHPAPAWERFVVTGKARANIRKFIRTKQRDQYIELGKSILQREFKKTKKEYREKLFNAAVLEKLGVMNIEDLYVFTGEGRIRAIDVLMAIYPDIKQNKKDAAITIAEKSYSNADASPEESVFINGLIPGMAIHYSGCCHPLPGDKIIGIINSGRGVSIHTYDCENLSIYSNEPERYLDISWGANKDNHKFVGRLHVNIYNKQGALAAVTNIISRNNSNILNLKITKRTENFWDLFVDIEVESLEHLQSIIAALRSSSYIHKVER